MPGAALVQAVLVPGAALVQAVLVSHVALIQEVLVLHTHSAPVKAVLSDAALM